MERNFLLPIAVAAAIHGLAFLPGDATPPAVAFQEVVLADRNPPPEMLPPEPPEPPEVDPDAVGVRKSETPPPPRQPNLPDPNVNRKGIEQIIDRTPPTHGPVAEKISPTWPDDLRGTGAVGGPVSSFFLDNNPSARFQPSPAYPGELKSTGITGRVTVTFCVDTTGRVYNESIVNANHDRFGEEVLRAVRRWRFEPGLKDGRRVAFRMSQAFVFTIDG